MDNPFDEMSPSCIPLRRVCRIAEGSVGVSEGSGRIGRERVSGERLCCRGDEPVVEEVAVVVVMVV